MNLASDKLLFVFDMANNHMGRVEHGLRIIREVAEACRGFDFRFGLKFQYRDLDTFIHPDYRGRDDVKYVKRFSETRLSDEEFRAMKAEADRLGFLSVCTPFDEASVDRIEAHGIEVIKIASCSFTDWPLLERVVKADKPILASTAGATLDEIDAVASFLEHRRKQFALLHCVAQYPTPPHAIELNQIRFLQTRYPGVCIGFSTHEPPDFLDSVKMGVAAGAVIFERHVGVPTADIKLNGYSAAPAQVAAWLAAARDAVAVCGVQGRRHAFSAEEAASLRALRRGAFATRNIWAGERILPQDVFLAIPTTEGQVAANDLSKYTEYYAQADIAARAPVLYAGVRRVETRERVYAIVQQVKALLARSGVVVPGKADLEISHHYGLDRFEEFGLTMITVVNREYCKKLLAMLPGQKHPEQHHKHKEETFHVLWGDVHVALDGAASDCGPGDVITVEAGVRHQFETRGGCVIEEISSTHHVDDSFYTDPAVGANTRRKTLVTYWMG
jgi:sialic acid synthase SpsE/mannose-6-phosphate isomerase-like protein (cupin superfamily)